MMEKTSVEEQHPIITVEPRGTGQLIAKVAASKHHVQAAAKETSLSDGFTNMNFGPWKAGMPRVCPIGGQMNVTVNSSGSWSFWGSFPSQPAGVDCTVAVAIGLRSESGKVVAFTDSGTVTTAGWTFSKQGTSSVISGMWSNLVKGHDFTGSWLAHQIPKANHQSGSGSGGGPDITSVVATITDILGVVSLIL